MAPTWPSKTLFACCQLSKTSANPATHRFRDYFPSPPHSNSRPQSQTLFPDDESRADSSDSTSTMSRDPAQYGNIYGASAVSAFGGPHQHSHPQSPYPPTLYLNRSRTESQLTVHALPLESYHGNFGTRTKGGRRTSGGGGPDVSPLATTEPNLVLHAWMYAAGRKYGVEGLKALALDKFKIQLTRHWYAPSVSSPLTPLITMFYRDSPEFGEAIHVVYNTTPSHDKEMRETVADVLGWHNRLLEKPEIEIAIMEINGLAYELLKRSRRAEPEFMG